MKHRELDRKECTIEEEDLLENDQTLCSLLVSLLPPVDYCYQTTCEVNDCVPNDIEDRKLKLLITVLNTLRAKSSLNIPKVESIKVFYIYIIVLLFFCFRFV